MVAARRWCRGQGRGGLLAQRIGRRVGEPDACWLLEGWPGFSVRALAGRMKMRSKSLVQSSAPPARPATSWTSEFALDWFIVLLAGMAARLVGLREGRKWCQRVARRFQSRAIRLQLKCRAGTFCGPRLRSARRLATVQRNSRKLCTKHGLLFNFAVRIVMHLCINACSNMSIFSIVFHL